MATDDISMTTVTSAKRPISRKHRILTHNQSVEKPRTAEFRLSRTMTATNRPSSKLPNLLPKSSIYPSTPDSIQSRRYRSLQRDPFTSSSSKFERQLTTNNSQTRLPTLYSLTHDDDHKRMSEFRRKQIYALNHLMRELEQEQFRQFCQSNGASNDNNKNEDTNTELLT